MDVIQPRAANVLILKLGGGRQAGRQAARRGKRSQRCTAASREGDRRQYFPNSTSADTFSLGADVVHAALLTISQSNYDNAANAELTFHPF